MLYVSVLLRIRQVISASIKLECQFEMLASTLSTILQVLPRYQVYYTLHAYSMCEEKYL